MQFFGRTIWLAALAVLALGCESSDVSRAIGARCSSDRECDERCLTGSDFPDGFCSLSCDEDGDCPSDTRCVKDQGQGACLLRCNNDGDCAYLGQKWDCEGAQNASGKVCRGD